MTWDQAIGIADIVTAISAILALILATWLGLRAIQIAQADFRRSHQEFMVSQSASLLEAATAYGSLAVKFAQYLTTDDEGERLQLEERKLDFDGKVTVIRAQQPASQGVSTIDEVERFSMALYSMAIASRELRNLGRGVLRHYIFDASDAPTSDILKNLAKQVHGHEKYTEEYSGFVHEAWDGAGQSRAFDGAPEIAEELRQKCDRAEWEPSIDEALRLVVPWAGVELGIYIALASIEDEQPESLHEDNDSEIMQVIPRWFDQWPSRYKQMVARFTKEDGSPIDSDLSTPEELTLQLVRDIRRQLFSLLRRLIEELRETAPEEKPASVFRSGPARSH